MTSNISHNFNQVLTFMVYKDIENQREEKSDTNFKNYEQTKELEKTDTTNYRKVSKGKTIYLS